MILGWFSCGATSAIACYLALQSYNNVELFYIDTGSSHPDNVRFIHQFENAFHCKVNILKSSKYNSVQEVLRKKRFINGPSGAPCTFELKKRVRYALEDSLHTWDGQVFGFDYCKREINRAIRFKQQNPDTKPLFPLIEHKFTKKNCLSLLEKFNIKPPVMYELGYNNNNCIGCVKGGIGYWNKIRIDFPDVFLEMSHIEREINATCLKDANGRIFLDELDPNRGEKVLKIIPDCSLFCELEFENIIDQQCEKVMQGSMSISDVT